MHVMCSHGTLLFQISDSVVLLVLVTFLEDRFKNEKHMSFWITLTRKCRYAVSKSFQDLQTVTSLGERGLRNVREARYDYRFCKIIK